MLRGPISISGSNNLSFDGTASGTGQLVVNGAISFGGAATLTNYASANPNFTTTINGTVTLGGATSITNNAATPFTLNGLVLAGANAVTINGTGSGAVNLTGPLNFTTAASITNSPTGTANFTTTIGPVTVSSSSAAIAIANNASTVLTIGVIAGGNTVTFSGSGATTVNGPVYLYGTTEAVTFSTGGAVANLTGGIVFGAATATPAINLQSGGGVTTIGAITATSSLTIQNNAAASTLTLGPIVLAGTSTLTLNGSGEGAVNAGFVLLNGASTISNSQSGAVTLGSIQMGGRSASPTRVGR